MLPYYTQYREADTTHARPTYGVGTSDAAKIDYLFVSAALSADYYGYADIQCGLPATGSDHCFYHGRFYVN